MSNKKKSLFIFFSMISTCLFGYDSCHLIFSEPPHFYTIQHLEIPLPALTAAEQEAENLDITYVNGIPIQTVHGQHITLIIPIDSPPNHQHQGVNSGSSITLEQHQYAFATVVTAVTLISLFAVIWYGR